MSKNEILDYHGEMMRLQETLVCIFDENLEKDKDVVMQTYLGLFDNYERVPLYTEIEKEILDINYGICFEMCLLKFEVEDEVKMRNAHGSIRDFNDDKFIVVSSMTQNMMNDISWSYSEEIRKNIKRSLFMNGVIFEDDDISNPLLMLPIMDVDNYCVFGGEAQQVMFPELHLDIFRIRKDIIRELPFKISNFTIERKEGGLLGEYEKSISGRTQRKVLL